MPCATTVREIHTELSKWKISEMLSDEENSVREDSQVAIAMSPAEIDDLFFERCRARLCLGAQHEALRGHRIHSVRFDRKVVVVAHDKSHLGKLLAGLTVQDGVEVVERAVQRRQWVANPAFRREMPLNRKYAL
jgi:hypothetical protein